MTGNMPLFYRMMFLTFCETLKRFTYKLDFSETKHLVNLISPSIFLCEFFKYKIISKIKTNIFLSNLIANMSLHVFLFLNLLLKLVLPKRISVLNK